MFTDIRMHGDGTGRQRRERGAVVGTATLTRRSRIVAQQTPMKIPFYFHFRTLVYGRGFVADVRIRGRITCVREFGATCVYGVNPGGLAAGRLDLDSAYRDFRIGLTGTLFDLATDAATFRRFKTATENFIATTDEESVLEWEIARDRIRTGETPAEGAKLRRIAEVLPVEMSVQEVVPSASSPRMNPDPRIAAASSLEVAA